MRGKIGQNPMIIDVPSSTDSDSGSTFSNDSDDSSGPETPPTDSDNRDRRYVWKPEPDIPIPQAYDSVRDQRPTGQKRACNVQEKARGREAVPKLDTDLGRSRSTQGLPPPLERARSPYASGPQDRKPKADRFSGEYMLSPDVMSPRKAYAESPRTQSQYIPRPEGAFCDNGRLDQRKANLTRPSIEAHRSHSHYIPRPVEVHNNKKDGQDMQNSRPPSIDRRSSGLPYPDAPQSTVRRPTLTSDSSRRPERPAMGRRASELPYPSSPPSIDGERPRSRNVQRSFDESDSDSTRSRIPSKQVPPQSLSRYATTTASKDGRHHERKLSSEVPSSARHHQRKLSSELPAVIRHHERKFSSELPASPLRQSIPSSDTGGHPVNLSSLVSDAAISQTLNTMLTEDGTGTRKASPRPSPRGSPNASPLASPRGSPKTSPFSSPPRTPPSESLQHRANPITGLKKDSPSSRPSSPLSSRSSLWTAEPHSVPQEDGQGGKIRPAPLSRKTAPLPIPHNERTREPDLLNSPGIFIRSPSPAKHTKSFSAGSEESQSPTVAPENRKPDRHSRSTNLEPSASSSRQRSASSVDLRPQLSVNTNSSSQSQSILLPKSRSRPASPGPGTPSQRYKPSNTGAAPSTTSSSSSRLEAAPAVTRPRSRSRSYIPETVSSVPTQKTSALTPTAPVSRSRSAMPLPDSAARSRSSAPKPPAHTLAPIPPGKLPKCPRPQPTVGYDDWFTLRENNSFAICPTCRDSVFGASTSQYLQPRYESLSRKTFCDLNNPWIRLALSLRGPDVKALSSLSDITSKERCCPGDELANREWYRLEDIDTGKHISGFNACPHCVHSLEALLPAWRNVFYRSRSHDVKERFCALRSSPHRFGDYLNLMVESALEADSKRRPPNATQVCELAKQLAAIDECPKDRMFPRKAWHIHPHLPEFTICQECYESVVYPLVQSGAALASKIDKKPHQFPNPETEVCCHLYSPRMRRVFREACEDDDYEHLRHTVLKRHMLQQDILGTFRELNEHPGDREVDGRLAELLERWKDRE